MVAPNDTSLRLYTMDSCPYCRRVHDTMRRLGLTVPLAHVDRDEYAFRELLAGGGIDQVPCLRIVRDGDERWLYESSDIIAWMEQFAAG